MSEEKTLKEWAREIVDYAKKKFVPEDLPTWENLPIKLAYIHSEVSECLEAWRDDNHIGVGEEFADIFLRLLVVASFLGYDLDVEARAKMGKNWKRPKRHGRVNV